jgi:hypothetical protein
VRTINKPISSCNTRSHKIMRKLGLKFNLVLILILIALVQQYYCCSIESTVDLNRRNHSLLSSYSPEQQPLLMIESRDTIVEDKFVLVSRVFPVHYIYIDVCFLTLWIGALFWNFNHNRTPILFSAIGLVVYYLVDFGYWYSYAGTRHISGPVEAPLLLLWVSMTPGVVHPSWAILMLEGVFLGSRRIREMLLWTMLFFSVQTLPAFIQPLLNVDERLITTTRDMTNGRFIMLLLCLIGYAYMWYKNIPRRVLLKIALIGAVVEGVFEFALTFSGIRPSGLSVFLFDSVFEFNCGMVLLFQLWQLTLPREKRPYPHINTVAEKVRLMYMFKGERVHWYYGSRTQKFSNHKLFARFSKFFARHSVEIATADADLHTKSL